MLNYNIRPNYTANQQAISINNRFHKRCEKKKFALIEFMLVVAIISILAAVAIPPYNDYIIRYKVTEANTIFSSMKNALAAFDNETGEFPSTLSSLLSVVTQGDYIEDTTYFHSGTKANTEICYLFKDFESGKGTLCYKYYAGANGEGWECSTNAPVFAGTTLSDKFLPKKCRSNYVTTLK
ncbi:pilin [Candidatus Halobeggiatoa sp. HSG11]|nr:pilin [Candidatus Halobeggiatoa sp. HSG11]